MAEGTTETEGVEAKLPARLRLPGRRKPDRRIEVSPDEVFQAGEAAEGREGTLEGLLARYALLSGAVILVSVILSVIALVLLH